MWSCCCFGDADAFGKVGDPQVQKSPSGGVQNDGNKNTCFFLMMFTMGTYISFIFRGYDPFFGGPKTLHFSVGFLRSKGKGDIPKNAMFSQEFEDFRENRCENCTRKKKVMNGPNQKITPVYLYFSL